MGLPESPKTYIKGRKETIFLFDLDGTLSKARCRISFNMAKLLEDLKKYVTVGVVSGSDLQAISWQLVPLESSFSESNLTDYIFSQNGTVSRHNGNEIGEDVCLKDFLGEEKLQQVINACLHYIADLELPKKRGTFIQYRTGMLNISPIGRDCSYDERQWFELYDKEHGIRSALIAHLNEKFSCYHLIFVTGGQISIDCYPEGWDKRYCLSYLSNFKHIYFFGDKTKPGENDYTIFNDSRVCGHTVTSSENTEQLLTDILRQFQASS